MTVMTMPPRPLETLETFAGIVEHFGLYAASYGLALQRMAQGPVRVCIIGDDADARDLEAAALARYAVNKSVVRLHKGPAQQSSSLRSQRLFPIFPV